MRSPILGFICLTLLLCGSVEQGYTGEPVAKAGEQYRELTSDGSWCWFQEPRAVYNLGRTYAGWVDSSGNISMRHYDHHSSELGPVLVLKQNLLHKGRPDDHDCPSFLILPDGRLQAFYSPHSDSPMWYRISEGEGEITGWGPEHTLGTNTEGRFGLTYPNPYRLADEDRIYLFWRGGNFKPNFSTSGDGRQWARARTLIEGAGARPYMKFISNGRDEIHFAFTDGHPRKEPANNIYYARYSQNKIWRTPRGERIKLMDELPMEPAEAATVYDGSINGRAWIWDLALNSKGMPVMVFSVMPEQTRHYYHYACWDGEKWIENRITFGGSWFPQTVPGEQESEPHYSGGVVLDHRDPSVVYLSRQVDGVFEIERWWTDDGGRNWNSKPVTAGSRHNNVRPLVSRARPGQPAVLFWMNGDYIHYTRFSTSIRMLPLDAE